jgi:hypothetical protein
MSIKGAQDRITKTVTSWEGVTVRPHRFGGVEYAIGKREIGHIHGDHLVDIPFPKKMRDEIVAAGRAQPIHICQKRAGSVFICTKMGMWKK